MGDFYLGPLGGLVLIPAPADPMDVTRTLVGAVHESLSGAVTVDRIGQVNSYAKEWRALTEDELTYLDAVGQGQVPGPLRFVDPLRRNRLGRDIASGGSVTRSTSKWSTPIGTSTISWVPITDPPVTVRGGISWVWPNLAPADMYVAAGYATTTDRVPLIPGETVRVSAYVRGTTGRNVYVGAHLWNSAGASTTVQGTLTALNVTTWSLLSVTYAVPGDGSRISLSPYLRGPSGQASATVEHTGWQVSLSSEPTTWALGGGAPVVTATEATERYELVDKHSYTMLLREAVV